MVRDIGGARGVSREYDWADTEPSVAVVQTITDYESTPQGRPRDPPDELLGEHIDADALDDLVTGSTPVTVSFTFANYHVSIDGNAVRVTPADGPDDAPVTD